MLERLLGGGSVPWREIHASYMKGEHRFIEKERQPPSCPLMDPSDMNSDGVNTSIGWFLQPQNNEGDKSSWFTFTLVLTSNRKALPDGCEAIQQTETQRGNAKVFELEYSGWVEKCQAGGNIRYPQESLDFERYLAAQGAAETSLKYPHWKGLRAGDPAKALPGISEEAQDFIFGLLADIADEEKEVVKGLVDRLNEMYSLMPAEVRSDSAQRPGLVLQFMTGQDEHGLWAESPESVATILGLPAVLPATVADAPQPIDFLRAFWSTADYFRPAFQVDEKSRTDFLEGWQHRFIMDGFLRHDESSTLLGGEYGLRWGVLAIIKFLLNIGALTGKLEAPAPLPEGINGRRVPNGLWDVVLEWCENWTTAIQSTISLLEETFAERSCQTTSHEAVQDGWLPGTRETSPEPNRPSSSARSPTPGQSKSRRLRPKSAHASKLVSDALNQHSESDSHESTEDEQDALDIFKPSGSDKDDSDEESDTRESEVEAEAEKPKTKSAKSKQVEVPNQAQKPVAKSSKGKQVAEGERDVDLLSAKFWSKYMKSGSVSERRQYEAQHGECQISFK